MSWREITLGDFFEVKHGWAFKSQYFGDVGEHIVMTPGNFYERGGFRSRPGKDRFYTVEPPSDYVLQAGDLVVAMTEQGEGLLGSSALIPEHGSYLHNQRIGLVERLNEDGLCKDFLYRLFNTPQVRGQVRSSASGTKVRHTAPARIRQIRARVPPRRMQRRLADVLSAYDNLIENDRRRIALLEEAAWMIYGEWFIHFRFPGHEQTKIVDGVPRGWGRATLGEIAAIRRGKNITKDGAERGDVPVVAGGLKPAYFHSTANVVGPVITVSASGANAGHVALYQQNIWASDCSFLGIDENAEIWFLYLLMKWHQAEITAMQQGAAQPHVYPKHLQGLGILVPPSNVRRLFHEKVDASFRQIAVLERQNRALEQARDLLLPRLMSGEIAV